MCFRPWIILHRQYHSSVMWACICIHHCVTCHACWSYIDRPNLIIFLGGWLCPLCIVMSSLCLGYCVAACARVSVTRCDCAGASIRNASVPVACLDISRQPQLCAKRYCTVGVDSLACVGVWKWQHFVSLVHESGIASPVNSMNYVWQEKVKAMFCIICRLFSKLTFGQPFAGFRGVRASFISLLTVQK